MQIDLMLMKAGSLFLDCVPGIKWLSLPEIVQEFEKLMTKQVRNTFTFNLHEGRFFIACFCSFFFRSISASRPETWKSSRRTSEIWIT